MMRAKSWENKHGNMCTKDSAVSEKEELKEGLFQIRSLSDLQSRIRSRFLWLLFKLLLNSRGNIFLLIDQIYTKMR